MSIRRIRRPASWSFTLLGAGLGAWLGWQAADRLAAEPLAAQDEPAAGADSGSNRNAAKGQSGAAEASQQFEVPKTNDVAKLLAFIARLRQFEPESDEQALEYSQRAPAALKAAGEQILKLEKNKNSRIYQEVSRLLFALRIETLAQATPEEQQSTIEEVLKRIGQRPSLPDVGAAEALAEQLDTLGDRKLAVRTFQSLANAFEATKREELIDRAQWYSGAARRLDLIGNPIKLEGTTTAGQKFDWAKYRGKVVLVDFWATWCGVCIAELPNIRRVYRQYHPRGFEVVGVSLDDDRDALRELLADEKPPWTVLHDVAPGDPSRHPIAEYYGIQSIPVMILVDREGKVVSLHARGPELRDELEKLLGPSTGSQDAATPPAGSKPVELQSGNPPAQKK